MIKFDSKPGWTLFREPVTRYGATGLPDSASVSSDWKQSVEHSPTDGYAVHSSASRRKLPGAKLLFTLMMLCMGVWGMTQNAQAQTALSEETIGNTAGFGWTLRGAASEGPCNELMQTLSSATPVSTEDYTVDLSGLPTGALVHSVKITYHAYGGATNPTIALTSLVNPSVPGGTWSFSNTYSVPTWNGAWGGGGTAEIPSIANTYTLATPQVLTAFSFNISVTKAAGGNRTAYIGCVKAEVSYVMPLDFDLSEISYCELENYPATFTYQQLVAEGVFDELQLGTGEGFESITIDDENGANIVFNNPTGGFDVNNYQLTVTGAVVETASDVVTANLGTANNLVICNGTDGQISVSGVSYNSTTAAGNYDFTFLIQRLSGGNPVPGTDKTHTFSTASQITTGVTATIPDSLLKNEGNTNLTYRVTLIDVNRTTAPGSDCQDASVTGFVDITVNPSPRFAIVANSGLGGVCHGTQFTFAIEDTTFSVLASYEVQANYNGLVLTAGTDYTTPQTLTTFGPAVLPQTIANTGTTPVDVVYTFTPKSSSTTTGMCDGTPIVVTVTVNPEEDFQALTLDAGALSVDECYSVLSGSNEELLPITGLRPGQTHTLTFEDGANTYTAEVTADPSGEVTLRFNDFTPVLSGGEYELTLTAIEVQGCEYPAPTGIDVIELTVKPQPTYAGIFLGTAVVDSTATTQICLTSPNIPVFEIKGLLPNQEHQLVYSIGGITQTMHQEESNASGVISFNASMWSGLTAGTYKLELIQLIVDGCTTDVDSHNVFTVNLVPGPGEIAEEDINLATSQASHVCQGTSLATAPSINFTISATADDTVVYNIYRNNVSIATVKTAAAAGTIPVEITSTQSWNTNGAGGVYKIGVTDVYAPNGCHVQYTTPVYSPTVTVHALPKFTVADVTVCEGDAANFTFVTSNFDATNYNYAYAVSGPSTGSGPVNSASHNYSITTEADAGDAGTYTIVITATPKDAAAAGLASCLTTSVTADVTVNPLPNLANVSFTIASANNDLELVGGGNELVQASVGTNNLCLAPNDAILFTANQVGTNYAVVIKRFASEADYNNNVPATQTSSGTTANSLSQAFGIVKGFYTVTFTTDEGCDTTLYYNVDTRKQVAYSNIAFDSNNPCEGSTELVISGLTEDDVTTVTYQYIFDAANPVPNATSSWSTPTTVGTEISTTATATAVGGVLNLNQPSGLNHYGYYQVRVTGLTTDFGCALDLTDAPVQLDLNVRRTPTIASTYLVDPNSLADPDPLNNVDTICYGGNEPRTVVLAGLVADSAHVITYIVNGNIQNPFTIARTSNASGKISINAAQLLSTIHVSGSYEIEFTELKFANGCTLPLTNQTINIEVLGKPALNTDYAIATTHARLQGGAYYFNACTPGTLTFNTLNPTYAGGSTPNVYILAPNDSVWAELDFAEALAINDESVSGTYKYVVANEFGCTSDTLNLDIHILSKPELNITYANGTIKADGNYGICEGADRSISFDVEAQSAIANGPITYVIEYWNDTLIGATPSVAAKWDTLSVTPAAGAYTWNLPAGSDTTTYRVSAVHSKTFTNPAETLTCNNIVQFTIIEQALPEFEVFVNNNTVDTVKDGDKINICTIGEFSIDIDAGANADSFVITKVGHTGDVLAKGNLTSPNWGWSEDPSSPLTAGEYTVTVFNKGDFTTYCAVSVNFEIFTTSDSVHVVAGNTVIANGDDINICAGRPEDVSFGIYGNHASGFNTNYKLEKWNYTATPAAKWEAVNGTNGSNLANGAAFLKTFADADTGKYKITVLSTRAGMDRDDKCGTTYEFNVISNPIPYVLVAYNGDTVADGGQINICEDVSDAKVALVNPFAAQVSYTLVYDANPTVYVASGIVGANSSIEASLGAAASIQEGAYTLTITQLGWNNVHGESCDSVINLDIQVRDIIKNMLVSRAVPSTTNAHAANIVNDGFTPIANAEWHEYVVSPTPNVLTVCLGDRIEITPSMTVTPDVENTKVLVYYSTAHNGSFSLIDSVSFVNGVAPVYVIDSAFAGKHTGYYGFEYVSDYGCSDSIGVFAIKVKTPPTVVNANQYPDTIVHATDVDVCQAVVAYSNPQFNGGDAGANYDVTFEHLDLATNTVIRSGPGNGSGHTFDKGFYEVTIKATPQAGHDVGCGYAYHQFVVHVDDQQIPYDVQFVDGANTVTIVSGSTYTFNQNQANCEMKLDWGTVSLTDNCDNGDALTWGYRRATVKEVWDWNTATPAVWAFTGNYDTTWVDGDASTYVTGTTQAAFDAQFGGLIYDQQLVRDTTRYYVELSVTDLSNNTRNHNFNVVFDRAYVNIVKTAHTPINCYGGESTITYSYTGLSSHLPYAVDLVHYHEDKDQATTYKNLQTQLTASSAIGVQNGQIAAGAYFIKFTDAFGCVSWSDSFVIRQPYDFDVIVTDQPDCGTGTVPAGSINVEIVSEHPGYLVDPHVPEPLYTMTITSTASGFTNITHPNVSSGYSYTASNLAKGTYVINVWQNGNPLCIFVDTVIIEDCPEADLVPAILLSKSTFTSSTPQGVVSELAVGLTNTGSTSTNGNVVFNVLLPAGFELTGTGNSTINTTNGITWTVSQPYANPSLFKVESSGPADIPSNGAEYITGFEIEMTTGTPGALFIQLELESGTGGDINSANDSHSVNILIQP